MTSSVCPACPLCLDPGPDLFAGKNRAGNKTPYFSCARCGLVFLHPGCRLDAASEKARYDLHRNHPGDEGYVRFLERLAVPLSARLRRGAKGLDFGCGPGPVFGGLMEKRGFKTANYDPFYFPDASLLREGYGFIACTEVAEHLYEPGREFGLLDRMLAPGGWLGILTRLLRPEQPFETWWYADDPTHVCFYRPETLRWLSEKYGWKLEMPAEDVILFQKRELRKG